MKIAICLSGLSEGLGWKDDDHDCLAEQYQNFKEQLISKYEVDFFVHTWNEPKRSVIEDLLHPKKIMIEPIDLLVKKKVLMLERTPKNQRILDHFSDKVHYSVYCKYSRFYSQYQCDLLRQEYENEHHFQYDLVIHTRFIIGINLTIDLNSLDMNKIYTVSSVSHKELYRTLDRPMDYIIFGNSENMKLITSMWLYLNKFLEKYDYRKVTHSHGLLTMLLKELNLTGRFAFTKIDEIYAFKFSFSPHDKKLRGMRPPV